MCTVSHGSDMLGCVRSVMADDSCHDMMEREFPDLQTALNAVRDHEIASNRRYAVYAASKNFGRTDIQTCKKISWEDRKSVKDGKLNFSGTPFVILGRKRLDCQFGRDRNKNARRMRAELSRQQADHGDYSKGKKFIVQDSKKLNCCARILLREICRFPTYKIQCGKCNRYFHFKSFCVGDELATMEDLAFSCSLCKIDFWPRNKAGVYKPCNTVEWSSKNELLKKMHEVSKRDAEDVSVIDTVTKKYELRGKVTKRKRSSFVYPSIKKRSKPRFCICKKPNDGRLYWQCNECEQWYHPSCIGLDAKKEPVKFICDDCDFR